MFGCPSSPAAVARHIFDYPLDGHDFQIVQRPPTPPAIPPPTRVNKSVNPLLNFFTRTPKPTPPTPTSTLLAMLRKAGTTDSPTPSTVSLRPPTTPPAPPTPQPTTPAAVQRVLRRYALHSPRTPSRLSTSTTDLSPRPGEEEETRSPYFPIHITRDAGPGDMELVPLELVVQKANRLKTEGQPRRPVLRSSTPNLGGALVRGSSTSTWASPQLIPGSCSSRGTSRSSRPPRPILGPPPLDIGQSLPLPPNRLQIAFGNMQDKLEPKTTHYRPYRIQPPASPRLDLRPIRPKPKTRSNSDPEVPRFKRPCPESSDSPEPSPDRACAKLPSRAAPPARPAVTSRGLIDEMWQSYEAAASDQSGASMDLDPPAPAAPELQVLHDGRGPRSNLYRDMLQSSASDDYTPPSSPRPAQLDGPFLLPPPTPEDEDEYEEMQANERLRIDAMRFLAFGPPDTPVPDRPEPTLRVFDYDTRPVHERIEWLERLNLRRKLPNSAQWAEKGLIPGSKAIVLEINRLKNLNVSPFDHEAEPTRRPRANGKNENLRALVTHHLLVRRAMEAQKPPWWSDNIVQVKDKKIEAGPPPRISVGWTTQEVGVGLGLGIGLGTPPSPQARKTYPKEKHPDRLMQGTRLDFSHTVPEDEGFDRLIQRPRGPQDLIGTPSPPTPEVITPEFDDEEHLLARDDHRSWPRPTRAVAQEAEYDWSKDLAKIVKEKYGSPADEEDDEDKPLRPKRDKGKGKAPAPPAPIEPSTILPTTEKDIEEEMALYGIETREELFMQYALEASRIQEQTELDKKALARYRDSPGASGSGSGSPRLINYSSPSDDDQHDQMEDRGEDRIEDENEQMEVDGINSRWSPDDEDVAMADDGHEDPSTPVGRVVSADSTPRPAPARAPRFTQTGLALQGAMSDRSGEVGWEPNFVFPVPSIAPNDASSKFTQGEDSSQVPTELGWGNTGGDGDLGARLDDLDLDSDDPFAYDLPPMDWLNYQSPAFYESHGFVTPERRKSPTTHDDNDWHDNNNDFNEPFDDHDNGPLVSKFSPPSPPSPPSPSPSARPSPAKPSGLVRRTSYCPHRTFPARSRSSSLPTLPEVNEPRLEAPTIKHKRSDSAPLWQSRLNSAGFEDLGGHDWSPDRQAPSPPPEFYLDQTPGQRPRRTAGMLRQTIHRPQPNPIASTPLSPSARYEHIKEMRRTSF